MVVVKKDLLLVRHGARCFWRHPHHVRPHVPGLGSEDHESATGLGVPGAAVAAPEKKKDEDGLGVLEDRSERVEPGMEIQDANETIEEDQGGKQETLDRAPEEPVTDQQVPPDQELQDQVEEAAEIEEPQDQGNTEVEIQVAPEPKFNLERLLKNIQKAKQVALAVETDEEDPVVAKIQVSAKDAKTEGFVKAQEMEI